LAVAVAMAAAAGGKPARAYTIAPNSLGPPRLLERQRLPRLPRGQLEDLLHVGRQRVGERPLPGDWSLTITGMPTAAFQYKFAFGSWGTADASYPANYAVAAWDGVGSC
jgi:hypothetical protein